MPRKPNTPCAVCGKMLWPTKKTAALSAGQVCQPCRRSMVKHGTVHAYDRKGCRCDLCTEAKVAGVTRISRNVRRFVYQRDNWTCQLCGNPVDKSLRNPNPMSATVDHIECQSWVLIADHSAKNLRTAHMICNSRRGNRSA